MKAIVYRRYGSPEVLEYEEVDRATPGDHEVLIEVRAASVNPLDWHFMRGTPYLIRMMAGLRAPRSTRLGVDVAGRVHAVGTHVTRFTPGDEVFGSCRGAFAEYVCASETALVLKPDSVTFEQAAAVPVAGLTALQGLRDSAHVEPGHTVLVNGAAGGVGTFAVQIAKALGARVAGVCSTRNVEMVRSIGADRVIDYTREDFTKDVQKYDALLDCVGNHPLSACRSVLNPHGNYVLVGGPDGRWIGPFARLAHALMLSPFVSQKLGMVMATTGKREDLGVIADLMKAGKVTPMLDRRYTLRETADAIRHLEGGHARGKVVIAMDAPRSE